LFSDSLWPLGTGVFSLLILTNIIFLQLANHRALLLDFLVEEKQLARYPDIRDRDARADFEDNKLLVSVG